MDSAPGPDTYGDKWNRDNAPTVAAALRNRAAWAARHDKKYHLGTTTDRVLASVDLVRRAADSGRTLRIGRHKVNANLVRLIILAQDSTDEYKWFSEQVRLFYDAARGRKVTPSRDQDAWFAAPTNKETAYGDSAVAANTCADRPASRDPEATYLDIQRHLADEPLFGPFYRNLTACTFWPTNPVQPPTKIRNNLPALIVRASGDPITSYPNQLAMHQALTGSRMITLNGAFRHTAYLAGETCIDETIDRYLLEGRLPAGDTTCGSPWRTPRSKA